MPIGVSRILFALALLGAPLVAGAQVVPLPTRPPADTGRARRDSSTVDSVSFKAAPTVIARDTIKAPLARAFAPRSLDFASRSWHWDRDSIFATGALNLGELLGDVPGIQSLSAGFLMAPTVAAPYGDPGALRIYLDGVELDPLQPRNGGIPDLAFIPLWTLEDVAVERTAGQFRVHLRSWRVDNTTPQTRVDVLNGSENLNLFRGWFGRRYDNGLALQFSGQQYSMIANTQPYGDNLGIMSRLGWARGDWSVDGTLWSQSITRQSGPKGLLSGTRLDGIPFWKGSEATSYLRLGWRDAMRDGPWLQLIAASLKSAEDNGVSSGSTPTKVAGDSVDTTAVRSQLTLTGGLTRGALRLSGTLRQRSIDGRQFRSPSARAEWSAGMLAAGLFVEEGLDKTRTMDLTAHLAPARWFELGASVSRGTRSDSLPNPSFTSARVDAALRFRDRWISAGFVTRSARRVLPLVEFDTAQRSFTLPAATAITLGLRGPVWRGWQLDVDAESWSDAAPYRPQTVVRSRLWFESWFLERFPRKNFHLSAALSNEYRTAAYLPLGTNLYGQVSRGVNIWGSLVEIRIGTAVISWQYRNMAGTPYETVPGYVMPRLMNVYGVRWEFWN